MSCWLEVPLGSLPHGPLCKGISQYGSWFHQSTRVKGQEREPAREGVLARHKSILEPSGQNTIPCLLPYSPVRIMSLASVTLKGRRLHSCVNTSKHRAFGSHIQKLPTTSPKAIYLESSAEMMAFVQQLFRSPSWINIITGSFSPNILL